MDTKQKEHRNGQHHNSQLGNAGAIPHIDCNDTEWARIMSAPAVGDQFVNTDTFALGTVALASGVTYAAISVWLLAGVVRLLRDALVHFTQEMEPEVSASRNVPTGWRIDLLRIRPSIPTDAYTAPAPDITVVLPTPTFDALSGKGDNFRYFVVSVVRTSQGSTTSSPCPC